MANKRMFTMQIVDSDAFLDMPLSTQSLYFHLNMRADDDGFIGNPKRIQRLIGASEDDLKLLIAKRFVLTFEDGVIVIKHWRMHNTIRGDRYTPTPYQEEYAMLGLKINKSYTLSDGNQVETSGKQTVSAGLGLDIGLGLDLDLKDSATAPSDQTPTPYQEIMNLYNSTCTSYPKLTKLSDTRKKAIKARFNTYTLEDFKKLFTMAEQSNFLKGTNDRNWSANFDWLIKDSNMAKVLDGNYANMTHKPLSKPSTNKFNQYPQRSYSQADYNSIEAKLLRKELSREV